MRRQQNPTHPCWLLALHPCWLLALGLGLLAGGLMTASADTDIADERGESQDVVDQAPSAHTLAIAEFRAQAEAEARNYDRTQDISPRQMLILLEMAQRTGKSLGQALATGEFESARTWNDFVRPTIAEGRLGSATGVWQFIPSTFYRIIKRYGAELLAVSAADASLHRDHMDLGAGPFSDQQVRSIIEETVAGKRDVEDEQLQLLRHNFAVLAFAKHYLSVDSGAKTPEEDYLFHFLGEKRGRQILALARGEARHTLSVAPAQTNSEPKPATGLGLGLAGTRQRHYIQLPGSRLSPGLSDANPLAAARQRRLLATTGRLPSDRSGSGSSSGSRSHRLGTLDPRLSDSAVYRPPSGALSAPASWRSAEWGLPADSPVVTGNAGMFYRDASTKTNPYTWAEFLDALSARVQAKQQPAMVRAKYGVGFQMNGGDMPGWSFNDDKITNTLEFRHALTGSLPLPAPLVNGPLDAVETQAYKERLAELIRQGDDKPLTHLPPTARSALQNLGLLALDENATDTNNPAVREALQAFRDLVGKDTPVDPALADSLMPSERVALELYDQRLARYAALQAAQRAALQSSLDLMAINRLLKSHQRSSRPHIARLQKALAEKGLQTQTHARKRTQTAQFDGIAGKLTQAALNQFQLRHGLRPTDGLLDPVTVAMLDLPPMGRNIFLPPSGPYSPIDAEPESHRHCAAPEVRRHLTLYHLLPKPERMSLSLNEHSDSWRIATRADETAVSR
ncbi:MAG: peptidoglycan-binding protein [Chromatiaceae bacterium]|nr:peptidoglycan-binding protein [Chromatiaceae bacterium]MCF7996262.1 peptidoglycan-binding protein [Chromatiaceae bacterium]MCF8015211.1 peptidoglycan-binding protein [Chromatiaceae bacterium]